MKDGLAPVARLRIRPLDRQQPAELDWVAQGMRATLIEVEGEASGSALYTLDWLRERARWHLDNPDLPTEVLVAVSDSGALLGHTILRRESDAQLTAFGLVSTTYVHADARRQGVAQALLEAGEAWVRAQGLGHCATWTSATNTPLIRLYTRQGYAQVLTHTHETTGTPMVKLQRPLEPAP